MPKAISLVALWEMATITIRDGMDSAIDIMDIMDATFPGPFLDLIIGPN